MVRIDDLDVVRRLDIRRSDSAFTILAQAECHFIAVVELEHHTFEVQQNVDHILLDAIDRRILVQHPSDRDIGRRIAHHGREQHAP
jgi:hypothetical protein